MLFLKEVLSDFLKNFQILSNLIEHILVKTVFCWGVNVDFNISPFISQGIIQPNVTETESL